MNAMHSPNASEHPAVTRKWKGLKKNYVVLPSKGEGNRLSSSCRLLRDRKDRGSFTRRNILLRPGSILRGEGVSEQTVGCSGVKASLDSGIAAERIDAERGQN